MLQKVAVICWLQMMPVVGLWDSVDDDELCDAADAFADAADEFATVDGTPVVVVAGNRSVKLTCAAVADDHSSTKVSNAQILMTQALAVHLSARQPALEWS
jgi:hypothetical protein